MPRILLCVAMLLTACGDTTYVYSGAVGSDAAAGGSGAGSSAYRSDGGAVATGARRITKPSANPLSGAMDQDAGATPAPDASAVARDAGTDAALPPNIYMDSDNDGVWDFQDRCPGFDDRADADHDGVPDGCDKCPGHSDTDGDANGYPDACDMLLWSVVVPESTLSGATYLPLVSASASIQIKRGDGVYVIGQVPLSTSTASTSVDYGSPLSVQTQSGSPTVTAAGSAKDLLDAVSLRWDGLLTAPIVQLCLSWVTSDATRAGKPVKTCPPPGAQASPIKIPFVATRYVLTGHATPPASYAFTLEVRGY